MAKYSKNDIWSEQQRPLIKRIAGPMFLVAIMFYLGFHAISGERGVIALFQENRKLDALKTELAEVKSQREQLERKVHLMSDSSLDLDMLDEQVHRVLGMANKNEFVYILDDSKK